VTSALLPEAARLEAEGHALVAEGHAKLAEAARLRAQGVAAQTTSAEELIPLVSQAPNEMAYRLEEEAPARLQQSRERDRERIGSPMQSSISAPTALGRHPANEAPRSRVIEVPEIQRAKARKLLLELGYVAAGRRGKR
jgi:hypothetical protein